jgi:hypothetical protein
MYSWRENTLTHLGAAILKLFEHGKATLLCPKSIKKNGQIITDLAKTVHFV